MVGSGRFELPTRRVRTWHDAVSLRAQLTAWSAVASLSLFSCQVVGLPGIEPGWPKRLIYSQARLHSGLQTHRADDANRTRQIFVGNEALHLGASPAIQPSNSLSQSDPSGLPPRIELGPDAYETSAPPWSYESAGKSWESRTPSSGFGDQTETVSVRLRTEPPFQNEKGRTLLEPGL